MCNKDKSTANKKTQLQKAWLTASAVVVAALAGALAGSWGNGYFTQIQQNKQFQHDFRRAQVINLVSEVEKINNWVLGITEHIRGENAPRTMGPISVIKQVRAIESSLRNTNMWQDSQVNKSFQNFVSTAFVERAKTEKPEFIRPHTSLRIQASPDLNFEPFWDSGYSYYGKPGEVEVSQDKAEARDKYATYYSDPGDTDYPEKITDAATKFLDEVNRHLNNRRYYFSH
ncbi:MAG: hypothetical protein AAFY08_02320 [Planctomycetota bacterium]